MRLSHLNALRALEATLRHGSFSAAAGELGITPAAVGQRVRSLELYLGMTLFIRSSSGIEPTKEAQNVGKLLSGGFAKIAEALDQLKSEEQRKDLRVTLPESFSENWLAPILSDFQMRNPDVELMLEPANRDVDLLVEEFDLAIRYGPDNGSMFREHMLFGDFVAPVCSPEFARRYKLAPGLRSLKDVPLVHVTHRTKDPGWVSFESWGEAFDFNKAHLSHGVRFSRSGSGLQAASASQGLVLCGIVEAFHALRSGTLVLPFGREMIIPTTYAYRLLWPRSKSVTQMHGLFVEWITRKSTDFECELLAFLAR